MHKTTKLRAMLDSNDLEFLMEAHNGISAKIVENTGFKAIWGSGLSISASQGVRDNNELSWSQVLDIIEYMASITNIPILLDADTGYGNFNNARIFARNLEKIGVAGMCIEDKLFPKTNSFINSEKQQLEDVNIFSNKIKAIKDYQQDPDFVVVARLESLIAGHGMEDALERAFRYKEAGADAILVHSKKTTSEEIESFAKQWNNQLPVVIVPTKYYRTPTDTFRNIGISLCIWANHNIRSAVKIMQENSVKIYKEQSLLNVENTIAPLEEIFKLQNMAELEIAESKYL